MTTKDLLLDHLTHTFEKEAWQPSLATHDSYHAGQIRYIRALQGA